MAEILCMINVVVWSRSVVDTQCTYVEKLEAAEI